jgi:hypothetical protein
MREELKSVTAECEKFYGIDGGGLGEGEMAFEAKLTATVSLEGLFLARGGACDVCAGERSDSGGKRARDGGCGGKKEKLHSKKRRPSDS